MLDCTISATQDSAYNITNYYINITRGGSPYFWQSQFYFLHCIGGLQCLQKYIFELEFGFYSGRSPRSFWEYGGCMRVCVNRNRGRYCFLFCKGPIFNYIRGHSDPKNICQIAENRIRRSVRGFALLPGPHF